MSSPTIRLPVSVNLMYFVIICDCFLLISLTVTGRVWGRERERKLEYIKGEVRSETNGLAI